jgi:hypothetical protein
MAGRAILILALAAALVAGCGGQTAEAKLKANVKYAKGGGIAGISQQLTVRPDGTGFATNQEIKRNFKVSAATRRALERAVRTADLAHTSNPKKRGEGADGFGYSVSYGPHRVTWSDFTADPPTRVERLYSMLDELYERYAPSS